MNWQQIKKYLLLITYTLVLFFVLYRITDLWGGFQSLISIVSPFLVGAGIAFILSIPMNFLEKKFDKLTRPVSLILTFLIFIAVILALVFLIGPTLAETVNNIISTVPGAIDSLTKTIEKLNINWSVIHSSITTTEIDWNNIGNKALEFFQNSFKNVFTSTFGVVSGVVSSIVNTVISFIFAAYILISKEKLNVQLKKILYAFLPENIADEIVDIGNLTHKAFTNFFTFQFIECLIMGCLFFVTMVVLRIPYALLISLMIAILALIPIFGLCIAFVIASILILMVNPIKVVVFAILFVILQQLEGNFIYPRIVGKSIGLPPIWVIFVITIGANLMGILGIILCIPLSSVIYTLLRRTVIARINKKKISSNKWCK